MIFQFENWYAEEFEAGTLQAQALNLGDIEQGRKEILSGGKDSSAISAVAREQEDNFEDEDAAVYRRAKHAVDELHRARKFEKSIKL